MIDAIKIYVSLVLEKLLSVAKYICKSLRFITPYILLLLVNVYGFTRTSLLIMLILPLFVWVITSVIDIYLNRKGLGSRFPIPDERFTEDVGDGEIRIANNKIQELILYTNKLENWFRDNGYTDK